MISFSVSSLQSSSSTTPTKYARSDSVVMQIRPVVSSSSLIPTNNFVLVLQTDAAAALVVQTVVNIQTV